MDRQEQEWRACDKLAGELATEDAPADLVRFVRGWWRLSDDDRGFACGLVVWATRDKLLTVSPH